ncbi:MAG: TcfC E-set like domain-containing protein [Pseudomonadota bacterium]
MVPTVLSLRVAPMARVLLVALCLPLAPLATAQQSESVNTGATPVTPLDLTAEAAKPDAPKAEPVFTLGPMPLLPPPSWGKEDDESVNADSDAARPSPSAPTPKPPRAVRESIKDVPAAVEQGDSAPTTTALSPAVEPAVIRPPVANDPPVDTRSQAITVEDTEPTVDNAQEPLPTSTPTIELAPSLKPTNPGSESDATLSAPVIDAPIKPFREPVMEQVDVTAKRLPPPTPADIEDTGFEVSSAPPPGFEDLAGAQTTLVDVIYAQRLIASVMATFNMGTLTFDDPLEVIAAIPDAKEDPALLNALTGPLDTHSDQLCYSEYETDCGVIEPDIAALIVDESRYRAELFIHPDYLETQFLADSDYLPRSTTRSASVHAFSLSANGDQTNNLINLSGTSLYSYRESRIEAQYDIDNNGFSLEELTVKHDARDWEYEAGAFRSRIQNTTFFAEQTLVGARVASSLNTRTDLQYAQATPLFAFLSQRARVDILRGDQLLDSRFYAAGNQQLDTSRLPDGAYNLTVRVVDESGQYQDTPYYFTRSSMLPPMDRPLYFAEAGQMTLTRGALPTLTSGHWLRAGTARRLRDNFGFETSVSAIGDATLIEGGLIWFQPGLQLQTTVMAGDSTGVGLRAVWQRDDIAVSADIRRISGDRAIMVDEIEVLPRAYTQANLSASFPFFEGRLLAQSRWDMRGSRDFKSLGINYARELRRFARSSLSVSVDTSFSTDDSIIRFGVDYRFRENARNATVQPRLQYTSRGSTDALLNARYTQTLRDDPNGVYRASAFIDRAVDRSVLGARISGETPRGVGEFEVQQSFGGEQPGASYIANARFGLVSSGTQVAFGGRRANASSVIIDIAGDAPDAVFEVIVDKQSQGYARSGSRTIISLPPYETYDIRLVARGGDLVEMDETQHSVTLYPGNVETLTFRIQRQLVIIGRAVDEEGNPIPHHAFAGLPGFASTDENGWFQIEVTNTDDQQLKRGDSTCRLSLPDWDKNETVVVLDELVCR